MFSDFIVPKKEVVVESKPAIQNNTNSDSQIHHLHPPNHGSMTTQNFHTFNGADMHNLLGLNAGGIHHLQSAHHSKHEHHENDFYHTFTPGMFASSQGNRLQQTPNVTSSPITMYNNTNVTYNKE
jgi:hypothetical protein